MEGVLVRSVWHQSKGGLVFWRQETFLEDIWVRFLSGDIYPANAQMHISVLSSVNMSMYVLLSVLGYNPVITIPAGATSINITEIRRSKNYLGEFFSWSRQNWCLH